MLANSGNGLLVRRVEVKRGLRVLVDAITTTGICMYVCMYHLSFHDAINMTDDCPGERHIQACGLN